MTWIRCWHSDVQKVDRLTARHVRANLLRHMLFKHAPDAREGRYFWIAHQNCANAILARQDSRKRRIHDVVALEIRKIVLIVRHGATPIKAALGIGSAALARVASEHGQGHRERRPPSVRDHPLRRLRATGDGLYVGALRNACDRHDEVRAHVVHVHVLPRDALAVRHAAAVAVHDLVLRQLRLDRITQVAQLLQTDASHCRVLDPTLLIGAACGSDGRRRDPCRHGHIARLLHVLEERGATSFDAIAEVVRVE
mmetsp:Transcript_73279/g.238385  ORF Transcript_73279/g.238385 Transcript_73279/m.238385 type:complete len:254 (-) Transcript_73279:519-1280(-)